jgi:hypothetical protein
MDLPTIRLDLTFTKQRIISWHGLHRRHNLRAVMRIAALLFESTLE